MEHSVEVERARFIVTRVTDGFEFGDGAISGGDASPEVLAVVDRTVETSPDIIVPVDREDDGSRLDDDGCGDGRDTGLTFRIGQTFKRSLNRAKVFGGSVAMTLAAKVGLGEVHGQQLNDAFDGAIEALEGSGLDFGAHIDEHAHGKNCGCGAIDRAPDALRAVVKYETPIRGIIKSLGIDEGGLDEVYQNFSNYADSLADQSPFSGRRVMDRIISSGRVIKRLTGSHQERRIVLNTVRDYTVNQKLIRQVTGDQAQIFGVDVWRMQDIARNLYADAEKQQHRALLGELVYTLGVAAVLTKGDLPVYMIEAAA